MKELFANLKVGEWFTMTESIHAVLCKKVSEIKFSDGTDIHLRRTPNLEVYRTNASGQPIY